MKKVLIAAVVLVVALGGVAWWQGWLKFEKTKDEEGKTHVGVAFNPEKIKQDRDKLKKATADHTKKVKDQLAKLRDKAKNLTGADKEKAEKEIDTLTKKHEAFEAKVKDLDGVADDKFEDFKKEIEGHLQEPGKE
jgi:hypothetical protein